MRRSYNDGIIGVDIKGIKVFYVVDSDVVVLVIFDDFVFNFFLVFYVVFDENLRIGSKGFVV